jgi:ABC-type polysaccharide/polyol phosphate export permease
MAPIAHLRTAARGVRARWEVLLTLAMAQLRDRFGRGHWRVAKWLLDPYAATGVYMVFVVFIVDRGSGDEGLIVACAVIPFQLFLQSILSGMMVLRERVSLIQNLAFPRELLPAAVTLTEGIGFAASLTLLPLMMIIYGVAPTVALVWLPVVLALNLVLALAGAYIALLFAAWYREMTTFMLSAVRILLFLAPGVVALSEITGRANELVRINPLTGLFEAYRSIFIYGEAPALWELGLPLLFSAIVMAIYVPLLRSEAPHLAKVV